VPRLNETAAPNATLGALCFILCGGVIALRIFWPVVRVAVAHQPISKVDTGDRADCDGPLLLVAINFGALDGAMGNESVKVVRGFLPATIVLARHRAEIEHVEKTDAIAPISLNAGYHWAAIRTGAA
jgi:hypothetical protein